MNDQFQDATFTTPVSASAPDKPPPPPRTATPLVWQAEKRTKWPLACLAAALSGWDPRQQDEEEVLEAEYDSAVLRAETKVDECRQIARGLPDPTTERRVFVLAHGNLMHAVVAHRPGLGESLAVVQALEPAAEDEPSSEALKRRNMVCWTRVLWPAAGSPERGQLMDSLPMEFMVTYPHAYCLAVGINARDVRRQG